MRAAPLLLLAVALAGCADEGFAYDASFRPVPGESTKYTLKVLNATLGNVTVEVAAPSRPNAVLPRDDGGVVAVRREGAGLVVLELTVDHGPRSAEPTIPTWTFTLEGLRRNTYTVDAIVSTRLCSDATCERTALGEVKNTVRVT